jgi:hypothetical protein
MKNTHVLSLLLVTSATIHAMENNQLVDYRAIHQQLRDDYKNYAINRLKEYKKSDSIDMNQLIEVGNLMTKSKDVTEQLLHWDIKDEDKNCFMHIATKKSDVPLIEWLCVQGDKNCVYVNADQEYPLDICIKQLLPTVIDSGAKSRQIFDLMVPHIAKLSEYGEFKQLCLKKIIALQLKHKRCNSNFAIDKELLQLLASQTLLAQQPSVLSIIYKETIDETDGSTLSHILVEQENPDELYELAKADQISWLKNNNGLNSFDIAAARFREAIQDITLVGTNSESITKRGCCLYILMHYLRNAEIKNGAANIQDLGNCCEKHVLK